MSHTITLTEVERGAIAFQCEQARSAWDRFMQPGNDKALRGREYEETAMCRDSVISAIMREKLLLA